jgi:hypothetical protein
MVGRPVFSAGEGRKIETMMMRYSRRMKRIKKKETPMVKMSLARKRVGQTRRI